MRSLCHWKKILIHLTLHRAVVEATIDRDIKIKAWARKTLQCHAKKIPAKFSDGISIWADRLCIGCLGQRTVIRRKI